MSSRPFSPGGAFTANGVIEGIVLDKSAWARMSTAMAGNKMGLVVYPEKDDEVLLDFVNGNVNEPVILGSLYNGKDKPPFDNADGKNNIRTFVSRSGHVIEVDDKDGSEKITIKGAVS